jgi:hypothetical protein
MPARFSIGYKGSGPTRRIGVWGTQEKTKSKSRSLAALGMTAIKECKRDSSLRSE